ncbi:sigma-70 family RNA polymerase sigma factor [Robiginitalea sp. M366]|uniref:RNA polymerase sigma factor n=1 Tax=Robiginitalea aestuariiviva TaxID=3036903 RepID=UPI00240E1AAC|nr:sigma-70 family RNA polymerase sigma factor [Robiginitalea aestuariiviva]MDG1572646.1 sigma-70 family RNA polymerase sigma factor [Robiginitalea aestuariiviva]
MPQTEAADLVGRVQDKDMEAFRELHTRFAENICGAINAVVRDPMLAEELCQDVFVTVWEKAGQYNASKGRVFTWLLNIARNRAIDHLRSRNYKRQKQNLHTENFVDTENEAVELPEESHPLAEKLGLYLQGLTEKCRQIIQLIYFRGYSQKAIAEELDIPLGTVKTRNRDCLGRLRKNMETANGPG